MPLYLKAHSYGEYVFDWAWADAYHRHGLDYYPKLLSAIPFTPVAGRRILADTPEHRDRLITAALALARELHVSSFHCLFPPREQAEHMRGRGMMLRHGVQFHWTNRDYADFDAFSCAGSTTTSARKSGRNGARCGDAGIEFEWLEGAAIGDQHWRFFARCYGQTYREHHSSPYLNLDFFRRIGATLPEHTCWCSPDTTAGLIAASLNIRNERSLFGRHWGALEYHPALHFEACYYQGIEYAHRTRPDSVRRRRAGRAQDRARAAAGETCRPTGWRIPNLPQPSKSSSTRETH